MKPHNHEPLKLPANRWRRLEKAFSADEGCIAVGGLAGTLGQLRSAVPAQTGSASNPDHLPSQGAGVVAIARLVQFARRESRQTLEQFAQKAGLSEDEVVAIETATVPPEPRVLFSLSETLGVSYQKLLVLAGHRKQRDEALERETLRFAASSGPMDKLSKTEAQALHDFLTLLQD